MVAGAVHRVTVIVATAESAVASKDVLGVVHVRVLRIIGMYMHFGEKILAAKSWHRQKPNNATVFEPYFEALLHNITTCRI